MAKTFKQYLWGRRPTATLQGQFVRVALRNEGFPDVESWPQLEAYLIRTNASRQTVIAAKLVWTSYRKHLKDAEAKAARMARLRRP